MLWATGITVQNIGCVGELVRADGGLLSVPLKNLANEGVPDDKSAKKAIETDFEHWSIASAKEYRAAFGCHDLAVTHDRHQVFGFPAGRSRVLVPALVLLRALFRPKGLLLPEMFGPNAIDNACHLTLQCSTPKLVLHAPWASRTSRIGLGEVVEPLLWMQCFPSAYAAAGSVHTWARSRVIGIQLPQASISATIRGRRQGNLLCATDLRIGTLTPTEPPYAFSEGHPGLVHFQRQFGKSPSAIHRDALRKAAHSIPRRANGCVALTDGEWDTIAPVLLSGASIKRLKLDQREIFSGLLGMLANGTTWQEADFGAGTIGNALYAYREWLKRGTLQQSLQLLGALRQPDTAQR